jgi:hypothetical protein
METEEVALPNLIGMKKLRTTSNINDNSVTITFEV